MAAKLEQLIKSTGRGEALRPIVDALVSKYKGITPELTKLFECLAEGNSTSTSASKSKPALSNAAAREGNGQSSRAQSEASPRKDVAVQFSVSGASPRGKLQLSVCGNGNIVFAKAATPDQPICTVTNSDISNVIHVCKLDRDAAILEHTWVMALKDDHSCAALKKPFAVFKVALSNADRKKHGGWPSLTMQSKPAALSNPILQSDPDLANAEQEGTLPEIINRFVNALYENKFCSSTTPGVFRTADKHHSMSCYYKVRDGSLYPTSSGILFLQTPIVFVPIAEIDEMYFGRGGVTPGSTTAGSW